MSNITVNTYCRNLGFIPLDLTITIYFYGINIHVFIHIFGQLWVFSKFVRLQYHGIYPGVCFSQVDVQLYNFTLISVLKTIKFC